MGAKNKDMKCADCFANDPAPSILHQFMAMALLLIWTAIAINMYAYTIFFVHPIWGKPLVVLLKMGITFPWTTALALICVKVWDWISAGSYQHAVFDADYGPTAVLCTLIFISGQLANTSGW
jgi:hypothetical protein